MMLEPTVGCGPVGVGEFFVTSDGKLVSDVAKITYRSTKKSVVTITKNGKATGKKKGAAVIEITVVLNDGTKKVIKTKVTVK